MSLNLPPRPELSPVAFYVHHHGSGHATRCKQLAAAWPDESPIHVFTSSPGYFTGWTKGEVHTLPPDVDEGRDPARDILHDQVLHYAPTEVPSVSRRMAYLSNWVAIHDPKVFIVDVSCEIALFLRLCGVKVALMRLHGFRRDPAHVAAFQLADRLLAPFPPCLEDQHTEQWVRNKTTYLGMFSRYDGRNENKKTSLQRICPSVAVAPDTTLVTVVNGSGGTKQSVNYWEDVAQRNPEYHFLLLGKLNGRTSETQNLSIIGYVQDTFPYLNAADIIVGSGGTNTMSEIGAVQGRYLSLPEERPFTEQLCKMRALERFGLTRAIRPDVPADEWSKWLRRAGDLRPDRWRRVQRSTNFTEAVRQLAQRYSGEGIGTPVRLDGAGNG